MSNLKDYVSESILDPVQENLPPDLWNGEKLKSSVRATIVKRLETWLKSKTSKPIQHLMLLGSTTGYQYTPQSDIDVNFIIDAPDEKITKISKEMYKEVNGKSIPGTEHMVNYFVANKFKDVWKKLPRYDILKNKWVQKAKKDDPSSVITSYRSVTEIARFFIAGLDLVMSEYHSDIAAYENYAEALKGMKKEEDKKDLKKLINFKVQEIIADIDGVHIAHHMIRALRSEAWKEEGALEIHTKLDIRDRADNSINNLIYKYVEKLGYIDKIYEVTDTGDEWTEKLQGV